MERDMDLVRKILLTCQSTPEGQRLPGKPPIEGYSQQLVGYHVYLMGQAGLLTVVETTNLDDTSPQAAILWMTWAGHDFADASKSPELWEKGKSAAQAVGGVGLSVMVDILKALAKEQLKKLGLSI